MLVVPSNALRFCFLTAGDRSNRYRDKQALACLSRYHSTDHPQSETKSRILDYLVMTKLDFCHGYKSNHAYLKARSITVKLTVNMSSPEQIQHATKTIKTLNLARVYIFTITVVKAPVVLVVPSNALDFVSWTAGDRSNRYRDKQALACVPLASFSQATRASPKTSCLEKHLSQPSSHR